MSITALGVEVFVRDVGSGEPILLLHGNPDSADLWDGVIDRLQDQYRCIAIDLPGFARSKAPRNFDCSPENLARFVDEVVEGLGIHEPINLVGHDFGGVFAMAWAVMHPAKLRRIVVINHCAFVSGMKWHWRGRVWRTPVLGELSMLVIPWRAFRSSMREGSKKLTDEQIRHVYDMLSLQWKWMALRLYRAANPEDFEQWAPPMLEMTAKIPTLVLWGEHDPYLPGWTADHFNARKVVRFAESGHWLPAELPEETANELRSFFAAY